MNLTTINTTLNTTLNNTLNYTQMYLESQGVIKTQNTILIILTLAALAIIGFMYIKYLRKSGVIKINKEHKENIKEIKKLCEELDKYSIINDKNGKELKIREINIKNVPREITEPLFESNGFFKKIIKFQDEGKKFRDYPLLLLKNDGSIEIKEGIKSGLYTFTSKEQDMITGTETEIKKTIELGPKKLRKFKNGKQEVICWVADENEAEAYPLEPKHHSKSFYKIVEAILLTRQARDTGLGKKLPKILIIIAIIAVVAGLTYWFITSQKKLPPTEVINATANITHNITSNITQIKI